MILPAAALEPAGLAQNAGIVGVAEVDGCAGPLPRFDFGFQLCHDLPGSFGVMMGAEQSRAGDRRKGHGHQQFRVPVNTSRPGSVGPAPVKHEFPVRVVFLPGWRGAARL